MFAGTDQNQPIGGQQLKIKAVIGKHDEIPENNNEGQRIESVTESDTRQLSLTEKTITLGDTEQDQIGKIND